MFKYERLPFDVKTAPAVFQQIMDTVIVGLDFATAYLDNILVKSNSIEEHKSFLKNFFERIRNYGLKIKENNCDFLLEEIKYLGHVINKDGKKPDKSRASAIKDMRNPKDVKSLQSFLGLVSYSQEFIPNLQNLSAPLNELLHKEKKWIWTKECENGNIRSGHRQTSGDERKKFKKSISGERENYSKTNYITGISSRR